VRAAPREQAIEHSLRVAARLLRRVHDLEAGAMEVSTASVRDAPSVNTLLEWLERWARASSGVLLDLSGFEDSRTTPKLRLCALPLRRGAVIDRGGASLQCARSAIGVSSTRRACR
jgi:hypothetical protein